jgi:4-amino-4-deoxy-L-arabinose transferase-like glycosyltransferase
VQLIQQADLKMRAERLAGVLARPNVISGFTAVLLGVLAIYYFFMLPAGTLKIIDEYWTLDRVGSFVARGDWMTVYSENLPNFNKPPLQYWFSALFFDPQAPLFALRLPSYIFALLLLPLSGLIAFQLCGRAIVYPVAMLVLGSSVRFWESGLSALLDMGATFFAVAALAAFIAATRQPRWWYAVAVLCGLASLQKAPVAPGFVAVAALVFIGWRWRKGPGEQTAAVFGNRHFALSVLLLLALFLFWPAIQYWKHGSVYIQHAFVEQMWQRFASSEEASGGGAWFKGLFRGQPLLEAPMLAAILALPFVIKRWETAAITTLFIAYVVLSGMAGERGSPRYAIMFYPLMAGSLSALAAHYLSANALPAALVYCLVLGTPFKSAEAARLTQSTQTQYVAFLSRTGAAVQPGESFLRCRWNRGKAPLFPGTISFYASAGHPVFTLKSAQDLAGAKELGEVVPPYRGICTIAEFAELKAQLDTPVTVEIFGNYVHWAARDLAPR